MCVVADAAHLARRCHIDAQHGVGFLEAVETELGGLDAHIVEIEEVFVRLLYGQTEQQKKRTSRPYGTLRRRRIEYGLKMNGRRTVSCRKPASI